MEFELKVGKSKLKLEDSELKESKKKPIKLKRLPKKKLTSRRILKRRTQPKIVISSQSPLAKGNIL